MAREKFSTLTEQMFYILLCLREECCGMDVMARVNELTGGRVAVGPGTLYNLLEQFLAAGYIVETRAEGRRRSYQLTAEGETLLQNSVCLLHVCLIHSSGHNRHRILAVRMGH